MSQLLSQLDDLVSEGRNPRTGDLDELPTLDMLARMNDEDAQVAAAVRAVLPAIATAVDAIAAALGAGGRLIYMGAGTSGRLGVLDASECPSTFGVPEEMVVGIMAGGDYALRHAVEGAEDDEDAAVADLDRIGVSSADVVVGLAASGRTPYVLSALRYAGSVGAVTIAISCNPKAPVGEVARIAIAPVVGPEVVTGSTRLKSGTAQKMVLNMLSTGAMVRIGKVYGNLMVDMRATNEKLAARAQRIVMQATGCAADQAAAALTDAGYDLKVAILTLLSGVSVDVARERLAQSHGVLRKALASS